MTRYGHALETWLLSFLMAVLTGLVFLEALLRQLNTGALWLSEAIEWAAAWFVLFGMSYGVRTGSHIGLTILTDRIKNPVKKRFVALFAVSICLIYSAILFGSSYAYVQQAKMLGFELTDLFIPAELFGTQPSEDILVQKWILYSGLLLGFALLFWRLLVLFYAILKGKADGLRFADEAQDAVAQFQAGSASAEVKP